MNVAYQLFLSDGEMVLITQKDPIVGSHGPVSGIHYCFFSVTHPYQVSQGVHAGVLSSLGDPWVELCRIAIANIS